MRTSTLVLPAALVVTASAFPLASTTKSSSSSLPTSSVSKPLDWAAGYTSNFDIHASCNDTERHQLEFALWETVELARHAKEHILVQGAQSEIYQKYFGSSPTAPVIGWLEKVSTGNREGIVFRCDDPDKNCETQDGWNGHHRGSNATMETVICPLSYVTRLPLTKLCSGGFEIATGKLATYFATDLMHRLFHLPTIGENEKKGDKGEELGVGHHADTYAEILELAKSENATLSTSNSASLYYFATEAYAFDIAVPGEGCVGKPAEEHDHDHKSSTTAFVPEAATATATTATEAAPEETEVQDCHTHDDGVVHCT